MKKLLVIGSEGFLGRRAAEYFETGYEVIRGIHKEMDITSFEGLETSFRRYKPDYILNCAAISSVADCEKNPEGSGRINLEGCLHIAGAALKINAKCIFCSSDQVYFGSDKEGKHKENEELFPYNEYGRQKLEAEKRVLEFNKDAVFLRLSWMYDVVRKSEKEHGDFMQNLIMQLHNEETIRLPIHDIRGITDVNEVIRNLEKVFGLEGGVYNFGSPVEKNMYETVCEVFEKLGRSTAKPERNEEAFRENPRNMGMDQAKINKAGIYFQTTGEALENHLKQLKNTF